MNGPIGSGGESLSLEWARHLEHLWVLFGFADDAQATAGGTIHSEREQYPAADLVPDLVLREVPMPTP